ncbi:MAG: hypothetical protein LC808_25040 [Actinobacteria bacterium]|nr:hypothetical protein [Actinomycetota bacterium]
MQLRKAFVAVLFVAAGGLLVAPAAWADPANSKNVLTLELSCEDGNTYDVVVAGGHNADHEIFSPAHDLDSATNFVPVAFEDFAGTIYDDEGTELFSFVDDSRVDRGNGQIPKGRTPLDCTFSFTDTFVATPEDAQDGLTPGDTYTFVAEGGVSGFTTGKP